MTDIDDEGVEIAAEFSRVSEEERLSVAGKLRSWIDSAQPENKEILNRLEADIREDLRLENWAAFTLEDLMQPPRYSEIRTLWSKIGDWVVLIRNAALFLPVLVTWIALERAADKYAKYSDSLRSTSEQDRLTFLQLWSDNRSTEQFEFAVGHFTLSNVAKWDFIIIALLIVLTVGEWVLHRRAEQMAEAKDRANDLDFRAVLVDVGLFLHGFRQITPTAITGSLGEAVNKLRAATTGIRDVADDMHKISASADVTLNRFAELSSRELEPLAKRIETIVSSLGFAVDAHKSMSEMVRTLDDLGNNLDRRLGAQTEKLEYAMREIVTETVEVGDRLKAAAAAAEEVAKSLRASAGVR